jgi:hypothetical protein
MPPDFTWIGWHLYPQPINYLSRPGHEC